MNKWIGIGRLSKNPEIKTLANGTTLCSFTVAVERRFKKEGQPTADFLNCTAFAKTAEFVDRYFKKGQWIVVEGSIQNRSWEGTDGIKRYATDVIVDNVEFAGNKSDNPNVSPDVSPATVKEAAVSEEFDFTVDEDDMPF